MLKVETLMVECRDRHYKFDLDTQVAETPQESAEEIQTYARYRYPTMSKTQGGFKHQIN
ncbi:hypothetical protein Syun_000781 [Stephania yunnanensis]|uniref:Uncharacterized protein n=1 Tax=Stephania yunnanensis TaxID=152371 RepID=A0AAP0QA86_9MAGN